MNKISERLNRILHPQSTFMEIIGKIGDFLLIGILWLLCSLPVITVGAASTALMSASMKRINDEDNGCFRDFFRSFRENFLLSTLLWVAAVLLGAFFALDLYFYAMWSMAGEMIGTILFALFAAATGLYLCVLLFLFPYVAKFQCTFRQAVKNAAYLSMRHFPYTVVMLIGDVLLLLLSLKTGFLFAALPGAVAFLNGWLVYRVFRKYLPKEETESEEE